MPRGSGIGTGGVRQYDGGAVKCVCPKPGCNFEIYHARGAPCSQTYCPKCGTPLEGQ